MRKRCLLFLVAGLTGFAAESAAPMPRSIEARREMMRKNAYLGEWQEVHGDVAFTLSFAANGWGVFKSEKLRAAKWKSVQEAFRVYGIAVMSDCI